MDERRRASDELWEEKFIGVHEAIKAQTKLIDFKLAAILEQTTKTNGLLKEHDGRIKSLENWRWYVVGIATVIGMIVYEILSRIGT